MLENYVELISGKPVMLHFTDHDIIVKELRDSITGKPKRVKSLVFEVDEVDGAADVRTFSIVQQKLASQFLPFLDDRSYTKYRFVITRIGEGFLADFQVRPMPY